MAVSEAKVRSVLGGPLSQLTGIPMTPQLLQAVGNAFVKILAKESKDYAQKRGWNGRDPMGGAPLWRSFKAKVKGKSTLEVTSTFYGMSELANGSIAARKMTWLTQEAKEKNPAKYKLTPREKKLGMKKTGRVSQGKRLPLIVPITTNGSVEFRTAPLKLGDAWVHPGIAKFTFFEVALRKWRKECGVIAAKALVKAMAKASR